jgi:hypothetical protein
MKHDDLQNGRLGFKANFDNFNAKDVISSGDQI